MKNLIRYAFAAVLLSLASVSAYPQMSEALTRYLDGTPVVRSVTAVSTDVAILLRYTGSAESGTVAVDATTGDLTFLSGASGSEAAEDAFECPVSGALAGVIDTSDTACNTLGEVVDTINGNCTGCSQGEWTAVLLGGLRDDVSTNTLITLSATAANSPEGLGLLFDGVVNFATSQVLSPRQNLDGFVFGRTSIVENPYAGEQAILHNVTATSTYSSGSSAHEIHCVAVSNKRVGAAETVTSYSFAAGATTAENTFTAAYGFACPTGQKMVVRTQNSAVMSASTLYAQGRVWRP